MKLRLLGKCGNVYADDGSDEGRELRPHELKQLNELGIADDFVEYMDEPLRLLFKPSHAQLFYNSTLNELIVKIDYNVKPGGVINNEIIEEVIDYTLGQYSDGIGEGYEQFPCGKTNDNEDIYISLWNGGNSLEWMIVNE